MKLKNLFFLMVICANIVHGSNQPISLQRTADFITQSIKEPDLMIEPDVGVVMKSTFAISFSTKNLCEPIGVRFTRLQTKEEKSVAVDTYFLKLNDMNPDSVKVEEWKRTLSTVYNLKISSSYGKTIKLLSISGKDGEKQAESQAQDFWLIFDDEEKAEKVGRAFSVAIKACGGEADPF